MVDAKNAREVCPTDHHILMRIRIYVSVDVTWLVGIIHMLIVIRVSGQEFNVLFLGFGDVCEESYRRSKLGFPFRG